MHAVCYAGGHSLWSWSKTRPPQFQNKDKTRVLHSVADPFDGSTGEMPLPTSRPDYASIWSGNIVAVASPAGRPDLLDMWPESTKDLTDMVQQQTGQNVSSEIMLTLSAGDTLAKILLKAKFTNRDIAIYQRHCPGT